MNKKVILNVESVYTSNAFIIDGKAYVGAGSETTPAVYLHDIATGESDLVEGCPGGVMSFVPVPGNPDVFYSIMGLFPGFQGLEAGVFQHRRTGGKWETRRAMHLPFAHRCDVITADGKNYLFGVSCSKHKDDIPDWSRAGEVYVMELDAEGNPSEPVLVDNHVFRNHGMLKLDGKLYISGQEGIFRFELEGGKWSLVQVFDREVSEFGFVDMDGDGELEMATIEPFHGEDMNIYKKVNGTWEQRFNHKISFGHGLSCGVFNGEPVVVVGNRRGTFTLDLIKADDFAAGKFTVEQIEQEAGPTQTQVFTVDGTDYILSANQKKNEVALYTK